SVHMATPYGGIRTRALGHYRGLVNRSDGLRLFLNNHMRRELGGNMFRTPVPELCQVEACEYILARTYKDWTESEVQFVNEAGAKILLNRGYTATDPHVLVLRSFLRSL